MVSEIVACLEKVSKSYQGTPALVEVTLDIQAGECLVLCGHNGSGKSTLIKTLLGFVRPDRGRVEILGTAPGRSGNARLGGRIGYLPENVAFDPGMTGREVMQFYARLKGVPLSEGTALLDRLGLAAAATRRVGQYSKGMRQRLGIAQALLGEVRLLLLDEPTSGLDPGGRRDFYGLVTELKAAGMAVLISSHMLSELESQADRVAILGQGRLLEVGALAAIRTAANLPSRIRLTSSAETRSDLIAALPDDVEVTFPTPDDMLITCRGDRKMTLLHSIFDHGPDIRDLETLPPSLGDLYAHLAQDKSP